MIYCSTCGKGIPRDSRFCTFCGSTVPAADLEQPNVVAPSTSTAPDIRSSTPGPAYKAEVHNVQVSSWLPFYRNPGFYGGLMVIIGLFLPWFFDVAAASGYDMMQSSLELGTGVYIFITLLIVLPAVGALIVVLQSFTGAFSGISGFFKWLAFLAMAAYVTLLVIGSRESESSFIKLDQMDVQAIVGIIGVGLWLTIVGCFIMLFNKRVRRLV